MNLDNQASLQKRMLQARYPDESDKTLHNSKRRSVSPASAPSSWLSVSEAAEEVSSISLAERVQVEFDEKKKPGFDFLFIANDQEVLEVADQLAGTGAKQEVVLVASADGLERDGLTSRLTISDNGSHHITEGRLFQNHQPLTLVLDLRHMTAEEIARFNDLLDPDTPALYNKMTGRKEPLDSHVNIVVLATPQQLATKAAVDNKLPGADFWRRVNRPENSWQLKKPEPGVEPMDATCLNQLPEYSPAFATETPPVTVNLHTHPDWHRQLFGGPGVDDTGRVCHAPGVLEQLKPGQSVILKGADWGDLKFQHQIRQLQTGRHYESNGQPQTLPEGIQFFRADVSVNELRDFCQSSIALTDSYPEKPAVINQGNLTQWLNPVSINEQGYGVPNLSLHKQIEAGATVTITSPLNEPMWLMLLGQLADIQKQTGHKVKVFVAHTSDQPEWLNLPTRQLQTLQDRLLEQSRVKVARYGSELQASAWVNRQDPRPMVVRINARTRPGQLFDQLHVRSEKTPRFGRKMTPLQNALLSGQPVVFLGLETNPELQLMLESLFCSPPAIVINGVLQTFPGADISLLWSDAQKSNALFLRAVIESAESCVEEDLWETAAARHGIRRDDLPEVPLQKLYEIYEQLPKDMAHHPGALPNISATLLDSLIIAARQAQAADGADQLQPAHWRKAINSIVTHKTRHNPEVRDFMKVSCEQLLCSPDDPNWVDREQLADLLNSSTCVNKDFINKKFWQLARAFDPALLSGMCLSFLHPNAGWSQNSVTEVMAALLVVYGPENLRSVLTKQLKPRQELINSLRNIPIRSRRRIKRLEDALTSGWCIGSEVSTGRTRFLTSLADTCYAIASDQTLEKTARRQLIREKLTRALRWQGAGEAPLEGLVDDLLYGRTDQKDRDQRRASRLKARLDTSKLVFIQGETGTGKSHLAARVAKSAGKAFVVSLGPSTDEKELIRRWVWKDNLDGTDREMIQLDQALLSWANTQPASDNEFVTIVLDESNLVQDGLLDVLKGLWLSPPCLFVDGQPVPVSSRHRVIMTGNPETYAGRHMDRTLLDNVQLVHYPALDNAFLQDCVLEPELQRHLSLHVPDVNEQQRLSRLAAVAVLELWQHYKVLLPEHEFTPRDLTDVCAWVSWHLQQAGHPEDGITPAHMNALIVQAFKDVFGNEVAGGGEDAQFALEDWFSCHYPVDTHFLSSAQQQVLEARHSFQSEAGKKRPDFDVSSAAVSDLADALIQDLGRTYQAGCRGKNHGGRQATLIEGSTGRGKDVTLQLALQSFRECLANQGKPVPVVHYLNACDCSWDTLRDHIQRARSRGEIIVISEMNLIDTQYLEGELNDILAGDAHPGFHLFATINPPRYMGRKPLSPALKGRFRLLPIREYNQNELVSIAARVLPDTSDGRSCAQQLAYLHCRLRRYLQKNNIPLQPTSLDLQKLALAVARSGRSDQADLNALFNKHYHLYLLAAQQTPEKLPEQTEAPSVTLPCDRPLCQWLNQTVSKLSHPWVIRRGEGSEVNVERREIIVPASLNDKAARRNIIRQLVQIQWHTTRLPASAPDAGGTLTQSLYIYIQHLWFQGIFDQTGMDAEDSFPLTEAQRQTLDLEANQPYLEEVRRILATIHPEKPLQWGDAWRQIQVMAYKPAALYRTTIKPPERPMKETPPLDTCAALPAAITKQVDSDTSYSKETIPSINYDRLFNSGHDPRMYRLRVFDLAATPEGTLTEIRMGHGEYGLEVVCPGRIPDQPTISLAHNQVHGIATLTWESSRWLYLPSLRPHERISALRTEPERSTLLMKDRYTGLHMLYIPDFKAGEVVKVHYIIEPPPSQEKDSEPLNEFESTELRERSLRPDTTCSLEMRQAIDHLMSTDSVEALPQSQKQLLTAIHQADSPHKRIKAIREYCQSFGGETSPDDSNLLGFLLEKRQGTCRHRTPVFVAFCRYYGIPARIVKSAMHAYPEYSLDGGATWKGTDLGGAPGKLSEARKTFPVPKAGVSLHIGSQKVTQTLKNLNPAQLQALSLVYETTPEKLKEAIQSGMALQVEEIGSTSSSRMTKNSGSVSSSGIDLSTKGIVTRLWKQGTTPGFTLGCQLLEDQDELTRDESSLAGNWNLNESELATTVLRMFRKGLSVEAMNKELLMLHKKLVVTRGILKHDWQYTMTEILDNMCSTPHDADSQSVQIIARLSLEQKWFSPEGNVLTNQDKEVYLLLKKLETVEALRPLVKSAQKESLVFLLTKRKIDSSYSHDGKVDKELSRLVHDSHGGRSASFESELKAGGLSISWTDEPEGIPDIGRLLASNPAFPVYSAGRTRHHPVLMTGGPEWSKTSIQKTVSQLLSVCSQNCPAFAEALAKTNEIDRLEQELEEKLIELSPTEDDDELMLSEDENELMSSEDENELLPSEDDNKFMPIEGENGFLSSEDDDEFMPSEDKKGRESQTKKISKTYRRLIQNVGLNPAVYSRISEVEKALTDGVRYAFAHYLYRVSNSNSGHLTTLWFNAKIKNHFYTIGDYGSCVPESPFQLLSIMDNVHSRWEAVTEDSEIREASGATGALVLHPERLTAIADDFLETLDTHSLCRDVVKSIGLDMETLLQ